MYNQIQTQRLKRYTHMCRRNFTKKCTSIHIVLDDIFVNFQFGVFNLLKCIYWIDLLYVFKKTYLCDILPEV